MRLYGGPWNERYIADSGKSVVRIGISSEWTYDDRPAVGARAGVALYEPAANRQRAFWSHNEWDDGPVEAIIEA